MAAIINLPVRQMETLIGIAREALQSGQLERAEEASRAALELAPRHPAALHLAGIVLALKQMPERALPLLQEAALLQPSQAEFLFDLAHALQDLERWEDAESHYRKAMKLAPSWSAPGVNLASVLVHQGRADEAIDLLQRLGRLFPEDADLANTLGNALNSKGYLQEALDTYRQANQLAPGRSDILHNLAYALMRAGNLAEALSVAQTGLAADAPRFRILLGSILTHYRPRAYETELARLLATALAEGWAEAAPLSSAAFSLLDLAPECKTWQAYAGDLESGKLPAWFSLPSAYPLALAILRNGIVNHPGWEARFTRLRKMLLDLALAGRMPADWLEFAAALGEQCFHNEYVFAQSADEEHKLATLQHLIVAVALPGQAFPAAAAVYATYRPLETLPVEVLRHSAFATSLRALWQQQITERQREAAIASALPTLTPIHPGLSLQVQQQYEENPYPRWKIPPQLGAFGSPARTLAALFPHHAPFALPESPRILIAGTGTGLNAILTARRFPTADILAIDLSRASLAYAARKADELGHGNIRFAQADILGLDDWPERFHIIESVGVLHHMADTLAAWRILSRLLEPGGVMKVGLYSRLGRTDLKPLQEAVRQRGLGGTAEEIRALRATALAGNAPPEWRSVALRHDFYTLSTCRDLLFHVHEQEFDLDEIARMIETLNLQFLGFEFATPAVPEHFQVAFPGENSLSDLHLWQRWEEAHPAQFSGMYQFWVRRRIS